MNASEREAIEATASEVVQASYAVSNSLGAGFLERVYENALAVELRHRGVEFIQQPPLVIRYRGVVVGDYRPDFLVGGCIVELKCVDEFCNEHVAQCLNYLRATDFHLALLINFQRPRVDVRRVVREL